MDIANIELLDIISAVAVLGVLLVLVLLFKLQKLSFTTQTLNGNYQQLQVSSATAIEQLKEELSALRHDSHSKETALVSLRATVHEREIQLTELKEQLHSLRATKEQYIELQARFSEKEAQLISKEEMLEESKKTLLREFELAASRLFDSKNETFKKSSQENLEAVLSPFKLQLQSFNKQVEEVYHKENTQRNQLIGQIGELQKQAQKISLDANNLAAALKGDNKVQGQWGEIILERLLEQSGLEKGREYDTQTTLWGDNGKMYRPDVVIHLPDNKDIVVDSKVALVEYERYVNAPNETEREQSLRKHVEALRTHMKALSLKRYEELEGLRTLDFVFMFVPIEAAYVAAMQSTPGMFSEAYEKNIMIISPTSLMVALRTVETMWRFEKQNANAEKIAASAGKLYDQFTLVVSSFEDVGQQIRKAGESHELAFNRLSKGRGNVLKRLDELKKLGAKTSKNLSKDAQKRLDAHVDEMYLDAAPLNESAGDENAAEENAVEQDPSQRQREQKLQAQARTTEAADDAAGGHASYDDEV